MTKDKADACAFGPGRALLATDGERDIFSSSLVLAGGSERQGFLMFAHH